MKKINLSNTVTPGVWDTLPDIFTIEHLKQFLGIGSNLAYELVARQDFPAIRLGRCIRISKSGLQAWIEQAETHS